MFDQILKDSSKCTSYVNPVSASASPSQFSPSSPVSRTHMRTGSFPCMCKNVMLRQCGVRTHPAPTHLNLAPPAMPGHQCAALEMPSSSSVHICTGSHAAARPQSTSALKVMLPETVLAGEWLMSAAAEATGPCSPNTNPPSILALGSTCLSCAAHLTTQ